MNKSLLFGIMIATVAVFANQQACANNACQSCCGAKKCATEKAQKYIGKDAAIAIALAHAKLERSAVRDLKCELDRENGIMIYEVEFESGLFDYEYDIDATSGKILKSKKEFD